MLKQHLQPHSGEIRSDSSLFVSVFLHRIGLPCMVDKGFQYVFLLSFKRFVIPVHGRLQLPAAGYEMELMEHLTIIR